MTANQAIGYQLLNTSTLTAIASTRIYHGMRPEGTVLPCINFFQVSGGNRMNGFDRFMFSINCRAATAVTALAMAKIVIDTFHGASGRGMSGDISGFAVGTSLETNQGLVFEQEDRIYNAPIDVQVVYPTATAT